LASLFLGVFHSLRKGEIGMVKWDIRTVYLYLISFVTLMMVIIGGVQGVQAIGNYFYPPPDYGPSPFAYELKLKDTSLAPEIIQQQIKEEKERQERQVRYNLFQRALSSVALIGVGLPVYLYHWRKIREKEERE
jgi:hypothetical protein